MLKIPHLCVFPHSLGIHHIPHEGFFSFFFWACRIKQFYIISFLYFRATLDTEKKTFPEDLMNEFYVQSYAKNHLAYHLQTQLNIIFQV